MKEKNKVFESDLNHILLLFFQESSVQAHYCTAQGAKAGRLADIF